MPVRIDFAVKYIESMVFTEDDTNLESADRKASLNDDIPDKFSGWGLLSLIGCFLFNVNAWGLVNAYALYLQAYINDDLFPNPNKLEFAAIGGFLFGGGIIFGPFINYLVGVLGMKTVILLGTVIQFVGGLLASFCTKIWQLYCTQGVLQGIGTGLIVIPTIIIIPQWFKEGHDGKRNYAMGITCAGAGIGGIVYNVGMEPILRHNSWRWALRTQTIMAAVMNILSIFLIRTRSKNIKPIYKFYDKVVYRTVGIQMMMVWEIFTMLGYMTLMYNLGDFTRSLGYGNKEASVVSTMVSVGIVYGRPVIGRIADYIGPIHASILATWFVSLFSFAMWISCKNYATAIFFALFVGSLMGTIWLTMATINAEIIGLRKFGIGMSMSWIAVGGTGIVSPVIGMALKGDGPTNRIQYQHPAIFVGLCYFGAGISLCILRGWIIARNKHDDNCDTEDERLRVKVSIHDVIIEMLKFKVEKV